MCAGGKFFRKVNRILIGVFERRVLAFLVEVWYASVVKERYRKATVRLSYALLKKSNLTFGWAVAFFISVFSASLYDTDYGNEKFQLHRWCNLNGKKTAKISLWVYSIYNRKKQT